MYGFCNEVYILHPSALSLISVNLRYVPPLSSSSSCVPASAIVPFSTTRIWSAFWMVAKRCAMVMIVLPRVSSEIACWIRCSFSGSMLAVASSRMMIAHFSGSLSRWRCAVFHHQTRYHRPLRRSCRIHSAAP